MATTIKKLPDYLGGYTYGGSDIGYFPAFTPGQLDALSNQIGQGYATDLLQGTGVMGHTANLTGTGANAFNNIFANPAITNPRVPTPIYPSTANPQPGITGPAMTTPVTSALVPETPPPGVLTPALTTPQQVAAAVKKDLKKTYTGMGTAAPKPKPTTPAPTTTTPPKTNNNSNKKSNKPKFSATITTTGANNKTKTRTYHSMSKWAANRSHG